jgi:hypothetical protein
MTLSFKSIERDFPHIVEMFVPLSGFGRTSTICTAGTVREGLRIATGAADALMAAILSPGASEMLTQPVFSLPSSRHSLSRNRGAHVARQGVG